MRLLFDQGTPVPLRRHLTGHSVTTATEAGLSSVSNGALLAAAEGQFDALITTDKNLRYQQNLGGRSLAILVLPTTSWPRLRAHVSKIVKVIDELRAGDYVEVAIGEDSTSG